MLPFLNLGQTSLVMEKNERGKDRFNLFCCISFIALVAAVCGLVYGVYRLILLML